METQAYFSGIQTHITGELNKARSSIYVAVAWLTDAQLFSVLCSKASQGIDVQLIVTDDDTTRSYGLDYSRLQTCGGKVWMVGDASARVTMHNKFCVIDSSTTITGSYNWSRRAQGNHENITITWDNESLANMFEQEFVRIKAQYYGAEALKNFDVGKIIKRLQIIANLIELAEHDQIAVHSSKVQEYQLTNEIGEIIGLLKDEDYASASSRINDFIVRARSITHFVDIESEAVRWEIKYLEIEIVSLESEKATIEKIISNFTHTYTLAFGELLVEILRLKKEQLKRDGKAERSQQYEKAEREYHEARDAFNEEKKVQHTDLDDAQLEELRTLYKKAVVLCHPDKFSDPAMQQKAHEIFVELQRAYKSNDLRRVKEIFQNLEKGIFRIDLDTSVSSSEQLLSRLNHLRHRHFALTGELINLRNDKTYNHILAIRNMASYFDEERARLHLELKKLRDERQQSA
jgi:hypothetical protein